MAWSKEGSYKAGGPVLELPLAVSALKQTPLIRMSAICGLMGGIYLVHFKRPGQYF
jgi:hypothetical protein